MEGEEDVLYSYEKQILPLCPTQTLLAANRIATKIIRSLTFKQTISNLFVDETKKPHISISKLDQVLSLRELFVLDKIRNIDHLNASACVLKTYDPWKIYLNILMLTEMVDRENEWDTYVEYQKNPDSFDDLTLMKPCWKDNMKIPTRVVHNSFIFAHQLRLNTEGTAQKASMTGGTAMKNPAATVGKRKRTTVTFTAREPVKAVRSTLSPHEKHILLLTALLVREASRLLHYHLSEMFTDEQTMKVTPSKIMRENDSRSFSNIGHMMEFLLFGYVIHHVIVDALPSPFTVYEVIGAEYEHESHGFILQPSRALLELIHSEGVGDVAITSDLLLMNPVSNVRYFPKPHKVVIETGGAHPSATATTALEMVESGEEGQDFVGNVVGSPEESVGKGFVNPMNNVRF